MAYPKWSGAGAAYGQVAADDAETRFQIDMARLKGQRRLLASIEIPTPVEVRATKASLFNAFCLMVLVYLEALALPLA